MLFGQALCYSSWYSLYSPWGRKESDTTERLSLSAASTVKALLRLGACAVRRSWNSWEGADGHGSGLWLKAWFSSLASVPVPLSSS